MGLRYNFPKGYYTMDDRIETILEHEEGKKILLEYFAVYLENERFDMIKKMPLGSFCKYAEDRISDNVRLEVNDRINQIKK
ncbi:MAG: hypothetical protein ACK5LL_05135 [Suipraeoptans sp.]